LKILGAILILIATSGLGFFGGMQLSRRVRELESLRNDFVFLEMEINYNATPLPQIFKKLKSINAQDSNSLWDKLLVVLNDGEGISTEEAWRRALEIFCQKSSLTKDDILILKDFGLGLGSTSRQEQLKKFKLIQELLQIRQQDALTKKQKNQRMWRSMGLLGGLALIILLC